MNVKVTLGYLSSQDWLFDWCTESLKQFYWSDAEVGQRLTIRPMYIGLLSEKRLLYHNNIFYILSSFQRNNKNNLI